MKKKILIVDDEKEVTDILERALSREGFEVVIAGTRRRGRGENSTGQT